MTAGPSTQDAPEDPPDGAAPPTLADFPAAVRERVLGMAAEALGRLAPENIPAPLKRVASFTPAKRVRLAGSQIAAVLEQDTVFREHLAVQVRGSSGALGQALAEGAVPDGEDAVRVAATAYLLGAPRWVELVGSARPAESRRDAARNGESVERLRERLASVSDQAARDRARTKEQQERLKAENVDLRRKLGEARQRSRAAEGEVGAARADSAQAVQGAAERASAAEAEVRRLRARVAALEGELSGARQSQRADRVTGSVRARLLLEAVIEGAQGLRRELALPALDRLPADQILGDPAPEGTRTTSAHGSLEVDDPRLLEGLLRLPRAHLVVDGYNISKHAWPELALERQRERLLNGAAALLARTGAELTVVFDAAQTRHRPPVSPPRGVRVRFSPYGVIADDVIREVVAAEPPGRTVVVATSDQELARDVVAAGFKVVAAGALARVLQPF